MKNLIAAATLAVIAISSATPSQAFFLPGGAMFSAGFDYVSVTKNNTTRTVATDPKSLHAVKARLFSVGISGAEGGDCSI